MRDRLWASLGLVASGYRGRLLFSILSAAAYVAYVFQYIEFDNHTLETLLSQAYELGDINHQKRYSIFYALTKLMVGILRIDPYISLVTLVFVYFAFLSFLIFLWMDRFLSKRLHKVFFFLCFFFLFPAQVGTFLTKDNNLSYYGFFLLSLFAIVGRPLSLKSRLGAGLASGVAGAAYFFLNFLSVAGIIFFLWGKSLKDRLISLLLLGLFPILVYQGIVAGLVGAARHNWNLGDYWHQGFIHYGLPELFGMFVDYKWGLYWNFGGNIISLVAYSLLFLYSIYLLVRFSDLEWPQKFCVLAAFAACNAFTFLMNGPAQDHWGPLCISLWCIFLIAFERFGPTSRKVAVFVCVIFFGQSFEVLRAEKDETFIGFTSCQVKLLRLYAEDEKQFKNGQFDYYVFPLAYLQISNYMVIRWPQLKEKILFTADESAYYQPVINVFKSEKFRQSQFVRENGLRAPNNLSGQEYLYIRNPEGLALLERKVAPGKDSFVSPVTRDSLCVDGG
jgi:hypothetical protein